MPKTVICLGITVVDNVFEVDQIPRVPIKILANSRTSRGGGPASTGAVASAHLGMPTKLWSWLGQDAEAAFLLGMLRRHGVDVEGTPQLAEVDTVTAFVVVDKSGERLIIAHGTRVVPGSTIHLPLGEIAAAGAVLVDTAWGAGARAVLEAARAAGVPAVLDAESSKADRAHGACPGGELSGVLRGWLREGHRGRDAGRGKLPGVGRRRRCADWRHARLKRLVMVDRRRARSRPCPSSHGSGTPPGPGDVFHGALAAGLADGMPLLEAARLASARCRAQMRSRQRLGWDAGPGRGRRGDASAAARPELPIAPGSFAADVQHNKPGGKQMAKPQFDFENRRVLVVGASRGGIGAAIADGFAACGAQVTITGIEATPIEHYVDRFPYRQLDVTDEAAATRLSQEFDRLDILVNCAGMGSRETEWTNAGFKHVMNVNLVGMLNLANAFRPQLEASQGAVVAIASMYSILGSPIIPAYGASKAGLAQLVRSLALAWAPAKIRVNAIAPGFIVTEQTAKGRADPSHYNRVLDRTPMERWGEPEDLVGPALFLASDQAKFVTGILLPVDGGLLVNL